MRTMSKRWLMAALGAVALATGAQPLLAQIAGGRPGVAPVGPGQVFGQPIGAAQFPGGGGQFPGGFPGGGGGQFPGGGIGAGQFPGGGGGGGIGGPGGGAGRGFQGGFALGPREGVIASGGSVQIAASCTDLFLSTPDHTTRFSTAPDAGQVQLADGTALPLSQALQNGLLVLRGRRPVGEPTAASFYVLALYLSNPGPQPVRFAVRRGALFTPAGQSVGEVPEGMNRLLEVPGASRIVGTAPMACAVWGARGSTRADVEETLMTTLPASDAKRTQELLNAAGIQKIFDREPDAYEKLYDQAADKLKDAEEFAGQAELRVGKTARVEGVRGADGQGVITLRMNRGGGVFHYRATIEKLGARRMVAKLTHLKSSRPLDVHRDGLVINLAAG
jgi:hypothetical protein